MVDSLGSELALAVRVCLNAPFTLTDPFTYAAAPDEVVSNDRAESALGCAGTHVREQEAGLSPTSRTNFVQSILAPRSRYSSRVLRNSE